MFENDTVIALIGGLVAVLVFYLLKFVTKVIKRTNTKADDKLALEVLNKLLEKGLITEKTVKDVEKELGV